MRGCFPSFGPPPPPAPVLPAYAGMFQEGLTATPRVQRSPRVCGDVSEYQTKYGIRIEFSPRMRGCFLVGGAIFISFSVLPAYAGMFLKSSLIFIVLLSSPRVCGDVSMMTAGGTVPFVFSPRMRGCFLADDCESRAELVLPAYAGMFLCLTTTRRHALSSPRVCGDVSGVDFRPLTGATFSPRMRGCFGDSLI